MSPKKDALVHLIRITAGAGKTTQVARELTSRLKDKPGTCAHVYTNTLALAEDFKRAIEQAAPDTSVLVVTGLEKASCKRPELVTQVAALGLPVRTSCCEAAASKDAKAVQSARAQSTDASTQAFAAIERCPYYAECPAQRRFDRTYSVYIFPHNFLTRKLDERIAHADTNVIDEAFITKTGRKGSLAPSELMSIPKGKEIVAEFRRSQFLTRSFLRDLGVTPMILRDFASQLLRPWLSRAQTLKPGDPHLESRLKSVSTKPALARLCEVIAEEMESGKEKLTSITLRTKTIKDEHGQADSESVVFRWHDPITVKGPILILDATANVDLMRIVFPQITTTDINIKRKADVLQVFDNAFTKTGFIRDEQRGTLKARVERVIGHLARGYSRGLVVTYKSHKESLSLPNGWAIEHFGNIRGSNDYEGFDCVVIVGRNQPPEEAIEDMAASLVHGTPHEVDFTRRKQIIRGYRMKSGQQLGVELYAWTDPVLQALSEQVCEQETVQALDRLRLLRCEKPKAVVLLCSLPVEVEVDALLPLDQLAQATKLDQAQDRAGAVLPLRDKWLASKFSDLFGSDDAAKRAVRQERDYKGAFSHSSSLSKNAPLTVHYRTSNQRGPNLSTARIRGERDVSAIVDKLAELHGTGITLYGKRFSSCPKGVPDCIWALEGTCIFMFDPFYEN